MSRPVAPLIPLVLAAALTVQGCGGYSENHRRGLAFAGGGAAFIGMVMIGDGLDCDTNIGGGNGTEDCDEDKADAITGGIMMLAGAAVIGLAYFFEPKDGEAASSASVAKGKK